MNNRKKSSPAWYEIRSALKAKGAMNAKWIAEETGVHFATVYAVLRKKIIDGSVQRSYPHAYKLTEKGEQFAAAQKATPLNADEDDGVGLAYPPTEEERKWAVRHRKWLSDHGRL